MRLDETSIGLSPILELSEHPEVQRAYLGEAV